MNFHPVRSLRQAVHQIGHAVTVSQDLSSAARKRLMAQNRDEQHALQPLGF